MQTILKMKPNRHSWHESENLLPNKPKGKSIQVHITYYPTVLYHSKPAVITEVHSNNHLKLTAHILWQSLEAIISYDSESVRKSYVKSENETWGEADGTFSAPHTWPVTVGCGCECSV